MQENIPENETIGARIPEVSDRRRHRLFVVLHRAVRREVYRVERQADAVGLPTKQSDGDAVHRRARVVAVHGRQQRYDFVGFALLRLVQRQRGIFSSAPVENGFFALPAYHDPSFAGRLEKKPLTSVKYSGSPDDPGSLHFSSMPSNSDAVFPMSKPRDSSEGRIRSG